MKRDVDLYGGQDIHIPPSCLLTVWTDQTRKPEKRLSHPVPLIGIDSNTRKIYVCRFLDTNNTAGISNVITS